MIHYPLRRSDALRGLWPGLTVIGQRFVKRLRSMKMKL
jgi:hypothetical protein